MLINPNLNFPENFTKARYHVVIYLPSSSEFKVKHGLRRNQIQIKLNKIRRRLLAVENIFLKTQYWNNLTFFVKTKSIKYTSSLRWLSSVILFPHKKSQNIYMMTCILHTQVHDLTVLFLKRTWHHSYSTWIKVQYIFHSSHFPLPAAGMRGRWWAARGWWRPPPPGRSQRTPTPDWKPIMWYNKLIICLHSSSGDDALLREFVDTFLYFLFAALIRPVSILVLNLTGGSVITLDSVSAPTHCDQERERVTLSDIIKSSDLNYKTQPDAVF